MRTLLLALFTVHLVDFLQAQLCQTPKATEETFGRYLQCIKEELSKNYAAYEKEVREQTRTAVNTCFAPNGCPLSPAELQTKAWDPNGSLKNCPICAKFLGSVASTTLLTSPAVQQCIRREIGNAMRMESMACLRSKSIDFEVPPIPDLEEQSQLFKDNVLSAISDNVHIRNHLYTCRQANKGASVKTKKCMRNPFPNFLPTHCQALQRCEQQISAACRPGMTIAKRTMCTCIQSSREDILRKFFTMNKVIQQVVVAGRRGPAFGAGSETDNCVRAIKDHMTTDANNWFSVIDTTLSRCLQNAASQGFLTMDNIIYLGCKSALKDKSEKSKSQLGLAFAMFGSLLDSMNDRSSRFCGAHCRP